MTTYNTENPIGSTDARDLYDNAQNFDRFSLGQELEYPDRLGVPRKSLAGIRAEVTDALSRLGYQVKGDYAAALLIENYGEVFRKDGEFYRAKAELTLPYPLNGDWAVDAPKFVSVGDAVLRQQLAAPSGSELIGHGNGSVDQALDGLTAQAEAVAQQVAPLAGLAQLSRRQFRNTLTPAVIDLHFGILNGTGWNASEAGGDEASTVSTTSMGLSSYDIEVEDPSIFHPGQLICYIASDNQYYSAVVFQKNGGQLRLDRVPEVQVLSGTTVAPFYRDKDHPSRRGAKCILDATMRQLQDSSISQTEYSGKGPNIWRSVNGATLAPVPLASYQNPGTPELFGVGVKVSASPVNAGAASAPITLTGGQYETSVVLNAGFRTGGYDGIVNISIKEETEDGDQYVIATRQVAGFGAPRAYVFAYSVRPRSKVSVIVTSAQSGFEFIVGSVQHRKVSGSLLDINRGTHVVLGDSWVSDSSWLFYYMGQRLDKASVINAGIGGNTARQMIERFHTDVALHQPDFVWVMVGTNDFYGDDTADVPVALFGQQINQLRSLIQGIGAQPIFWTPSVGQNVVGKDRLPRSRAYALNVNYHGTEPGLGSLHTFRDSQVGARGVAVPANGNAIVGVIAGQTRRPVTLRFAAASNPSLTLSVGFSASPDGSSLSEVTTVPLTGVVRDVVIPRASAPADLRFVVVRLDNPTSGAITASIVTDIAWSQSDD
ncbi:SGNH/GDSL hydrolase family protein [Stutzerimonas nitrititolerans]|uniref:SGNH/GDSL hydrolase family protein n=1 Tax=Stutzerimonas nitrititolerans TaxID=2482751 RepID=UPI0028A21B7C|nr:GDSL-type esterase/lipase family protein [Stutzerimonas nitrititolerans]